MMLAEEAVTWSNLVSGLAAFALAAGAKYAKMLRTYVFDLWAKFDRVSQVLDSTVKEIRHVSGALKRIENAQTLEDVKLAAGEIRQAFRFAIDAAESLAVQLPPAGGKPCNGK